MAKETFEVTGELPVGGKAKGEDVSLDLQPHEREALIASGALKPKKASSKEEK